MIDGLEAIAVVLVMAYLVGVFRESKREATPTHVCGRCCAVSGGKRVLPGSWFITFLLAWLLLVPALIYAVWRRSAAKRVCPTCGSQELVPVETPRGRQLLADARRAEAGQLRERFSL